MYHLSQKDAKSDSDNCVSSLSKNPIDSNLLVTGACKCFIICHTPVSPHHIKVMHPMNKGNNISGFRENEKCTTQTCALSSIYGKKKQESLPEKFKWLLYFEDGIHCLLTCLHNRLFQEDLLYAANIVILHFQHSRHCQDFCHYEIMWIFVIEKVRDYSVKGGTN